MCVALCFSRGVDTTSAPTRRRWFHSLGYEKRLHKYTNQRAASSACALVAMRWPMRYASPPARLRAPLPFNAKPSCGKRGACYARAVRVNPQNHSRSSRSRRVVARIRVSNARAMNLARSHTHLLLDCAHVLIYFAATQVKHESFILWTSRAGQRRGASVVVPARDVASEEAWVDEGVVFSEGHG